MIRRQRAMDEAYAFVQSGKQPDSLKLCRLSTVPEPIYGPYRVWLDVLIDHYMDLLQAPGGHVLDIFKSVYPKRNHYLLFVNRLNTVEKEFNAALKPHLPDEIDDAANIVKAMETYSAQWRRRQANSIFSGTHSS